MDYAGCYIFDGRILITAEGRTRTSGWSEHRLHMVRKNDDGREASFEFLACRPNGMSLQALWKASASEDLDLAAFPALETVTVTSETKTEPAPCRHRSPPPAKVKP